MNPEVFENCSTILIDIAGTVGSINFTKETLFAFAKKNIEEYLSAKWEDEEVKKLVAELKGDAEDLPDVTKAVERFNALTDENSVNTGLKTLQGLLYKQGYENGELKAHVFDDVKSALEQWSKHRKICIYSTGALEAQKQYFAHSTAGDLCDFIAKYFDQTIGKKTAAESYESIAKSLEVKTQDIVFLSDDIEEIKAATQAGCAGVLITREGNAVVSEEDKKDRVVVSTFADLSLLSAKRKSEEAVSAEEPPAKVAKLESEVEPEETKKSAESMEVDALETTPEEVKTSEPTKTDAEPVAEKTETATETKEKKDDTKVESTTDAAPDTTDKATTVEPAEVVEAEKTEVKAEKAEEATASDKEEVKPTAEADSTKAVAEEEKSAAIEEPATTEVVPVNDEAKTEVTENGKENGNEMEEKANGDVADEKENKRDIANGTVEPTTETEKNGDGEAIEEVKVKKIDDSPETAAPVTVEA